MVDGNEENRAVIAEQPVVSPQEPPPPDPRTAVPEVGRIGLGQPPPQVTGTLWVIVVSTFAILLLGAGVAVYALTAAGKDPKDFVPLATAAIGVLAGLLAPSPVAQR
jgi:hypothetical protein